MNKKTLAAGYMLLPILILNTGCVNNSQPQIVEHNTTREILIPHNDQLKKAVVVLIHKVKALESQINTKPKNIQDGNTTALEISRLRSEINTLKRQISDNKRVFDDFNCTKDLRTNSEEVIITTTTEVVDDYEDHEYDQIIKDFAQESQK